MLVKSTSLGRPGSRPAGLAKLGSRRPLHRLSSDSVRCRLFCGDCCQDRGGRRDARRGHGQAQPGSPSSGASSRPGRLRSLPNHQPFLLPFWSTYSNFLLGIPPTPSAAHLILEGRPHPPAPGEVRGGRGDPSWSLRASHWWGPRGTECWLPPELRLVGGNPGETAATQVPTRELAANVREGGTRGKRSRACVKGLRTPAALGPPPLGHKSLNAPWAPPLHHSWFCGPGVGAGGCFQPGLHEKDVRASKSIPVQSRELRGR